MQKAISFLLAMVMVFSVLSAFAEEEKDQTLIVLASEMADSTADLYSDRNIVGIYLTGPNGVMDEVLNAANTWKQADQPRRAAVIFLPRSSLELHIAPLLSAFGAPMIGDYISLLAPRLFMSIPSYLNGQMGVDWMAAASIMTMDDVCILEAIQPGYACVILDSGMEEAPMAFVTFCIKEDGAALVRSSFVRSAALEPLFHLSKQEFVTFIGSFLASENTMNTPPDPDMLSGVHFAVYQD